MENEQEHQHAYVIVYQITYKDREYHGSYIATAASDKLDLETYKALEADLEHWAVHEYKVEKKQVLIINIIKLEE